MSEYDPPSDDLNGPDGPNDGDATEDNYEPRFRKGSSTLGEAARRRREVLGITQEEVAERFGGPSVASLRTIENGQSANYRAKTLFSLDAALAWPSGASITLLSGRMDRLRTNWGDGWEPRLDFLKDDPWGGAFRNSGPSLTPWEYDTLVDILVQYVSDNVAKKYDVPIWSASPPQQVQSGVSERTENESSEEADHSPAPSLMVLLDEEMEKHPPRIHEDERYNKVLLAMASLDADELEELGRFAINMARMTRLMDISKKAGRTRAVQEFREAEQRTKSRIDSDFDFTSEGRERDEGSELPKFGRQADGG